MATQCGLSSSKIHCLASDQTVCLRRSRSSMAAVACTDQAVDAGMTALNTLEGLTHGEEDVPQEAKA